MRFLNQKLGKRTSRKFDLLKSRLSAERVPKNSRPGRKNRRPESRGSGARTVIQADPDTLSM